MYLVHGVENPTKYICIFSFPFYGNRGPPADGNLCTATGLPKNDAKQDLPCHCPIVAVLPSVFSLLLL